MRRVEIKTDIPIFNSKRVDIKFDKPVVQMETTEIKLHLPHFYLKEVDVEIAEHQREIEEVSSDLTSSLSSVQNEMRRELKTEITKEITDMFDEIHDSIMNNRESVSKSYEDAITKTKTAIKRLKENNATAEVQKLENQLASTVAEFKGTLEVIDSSLEELHQQEDEALRGLNFG